MHVPLRILFVGRLTSGKRLDVVIRALGLLLRSELDATLTVVGEGPERTSLEVLVCDEGVDDRVRFEGGVALDRVMDFYEHSDVLVLVSDTEGWPKAVAEAMAFGLVCIGSDRTGAARLLADGRGITVPPGDFAGLAHALRRVAEDPDAGAEMGRRAAGWSQRFGLEGLREEIRSLLERWWKVPIQPENSREQALDGGPESVS